jgi:hypothetical protein
MLALRGFVWVEWVLSEFHLHIICHIRTWTDHENSRGCASRSTRLLHQADEPRLSSRLVDSVGDIRPQHGIAKQMEFPIPSV